MEHTRSILADGPTAGGRTVHPVMWSENLRDYLNRVARAEEAGYSLVDTQIAPAFLLCTEGDFDKAERLVLSVLGDNLELAKQNGEVFISFLYVLFVVQRFDLFGALLRDRFGFPGDVHVAMEQTGFGLAILQWEISADRRHRFLFDAAVLRTDSTRIEVLAFFWGFPLLANYANQAAIETGSVLLNRADTGMTPGLAYSDNRPDFFLVPDASFVATKGYEHVRQVVAANRIPWEDRAPVAFWRGFTTGMKPNPREWRGMERIRLCEIARASRHIGLFDVGISQISQFSDPDAIREIEDSGLIVGRVPWSDYGRYKFLIEIDGNTVSFSEHIPKAADRQHPAQGRIKPRTYAMVLLRTHPVA